MRLSIDYIIISSTSTTDHEEGVIIYLMSFMPYKLH